MSQPTSRPNELAGLLTKYADGFAKNAADQALLEEVLRRLPQTNDPNELRWIADRAWDEYYCVDVDVMVPLLRRWLELDPNSKEAKRALGGYLLAHGPDWDEEGNQLLQEANS